jgi:protein ImuB
MERGCNMGVGEVKEPLYVCVYVPKFPAQALMRLRPELAQLPVVVLAGDPPLEQVCSFNSKASKLGVEQGMSRAELDSFAGLHVMRRSEEEERLGRAALLEVAGAFTPRVEIQPSPLSDFIMVLDMTGTTLIFGFAPQMAGSVLRSIKALRFHVQIAASANLATAVCIAPSVHKTPLVIASGQEKIHLSRLALSALNLTAQHAETLADWGLRTLGDLTAIPEVDLVVRLGQTGKRLRLLACGEHPHLMVPEEPAFVLEEFIAFDAPVELLDSLLFVLSPMLDQLLARAQNRAFALASVTVRLRLDGGGVHERTVKPALPVMQREILLKLLHLDLQAHPPPAGVQSVFVHAEPGDRSKVQLGLFSPQLPEPLRLDVTLARIAALVGESRVGSAKLLDSHHPDSFTMEPFVVPVKTAKQDVPVKTVATLRRCRPPVPLLVRRKAQHPSAFSFQGKWYKVQESYGPWRKSGDWWSSSVWSREEWDISASAGPADTLLCVLTQDLLRQQWHMEALYD